MLFVNVPMHKAMLMPTIANGKVVQCNVMYLPLLCTQPLLQWLMHSWATVTGHVGDILWCCAAHYSMQYLPANSLPHVWWPLCSTQVIFPGSNVLKKWEGLVTVVWQLQSSFVVFTYASVTNIVNAF